MAWTSSKKIAWFGYKFGKGGRQDGAQYGPMAAFLSTKQIFDRFGLGYTYADVVPQEFSHYNETTDGKITRSDTGELATPCSPKEIKQGCENPIGVKNLSHTVGAVSHLIAYTAHALLNPEKHMVFTLGGDHSQGLGTIKGVMLAAVANAISQGLLPAKVHNQEQEWLLEGFSSVLEQFKQSDETILYGNAHKLSVAIGRLIDRNIFIRHSNAEHIRRMPDISPVRGMVGTPEPVREIGLKKKLAEQSAYLGEQDSLFAFTREDTGAINVADLKIFLSRIHVIWLDAHADFNTDKTSITKNAHGMSAAAACGLGAEGLTRILDMWWAELPPANLHIVGARDTDKEERELVRKSGVDMWRMRRIAEFAKKNNHPLQEGIRLVFEQIIQKAKAKHKDNLILIGSFDLDGIHMQPEVEDDYWGKPHPSLRKGVFPKLATGTPVSKGGPRKQDVLEAMQGFAMRPETVAVDLTEFSPNLLHHDPEQRTIEVHAALVEAMFDNQRFVQSLHYYS